MGALRVLLVDDSPDFLAAAAAYLAGRQGLEVIGTLRSGREALEQVPRMRPDLVLLDLIMPGMNGLETLGRLKALPQPPRVVLLTLHQDAAFRRAAEAGGADGFVGKAEFNERLTPLLESLSR